jgi:hypothetical protein
MLMSTRLQVLLDEAEMREIREVAARQHMTVAEWVRQALRAARRREPRIAAERKLDALRKASEHAFPTADIDTMLEEIRRGYLDGSQR